MGHCARHPMNPFDRELTQRLDEWRDQSLLRELRAVQSPQGARIQVNGRELLNFSSNDYLGLASHPALKEAAVRAIERFGAGAGASRLISGSLSPHHELDETLAAFKGTEAALSFSSGYTTAVGTICALLGRDDWVLIDRLVHASIVDAARLSSARLRVFRHNDLDDLQRILRQVNRRRANSISGSPRPRVLIVTESVFSMTGTLAPLKELVQIKDAAGAWLMVDEAHATGLYGPNRRGLADELGVGDRIEIQMGTLGKAVGAAGGFICGSRPLIHLLVNRARSFVFSTAPPPAAAAAATAGICVIQSDEGARRVTRLWNSVSSLEAQLRAHAPSLARHASRSAILPVVVGLESKALDAASVLQERGLFVPAIRYPSVRRGAAQLCVSITAMHSDADISALASALASSVNPL